jgi:hypothetical protein
MFTFLGSQWPLLSEAERQTWASNFQTDPPERFLNYMSVNLTRWTAHLGPSKTNPPTEATTPGQIDNFSATGATGYVDLLWRQHLPTNAWAWLFYRSQTPGFTPGPQNLAIHRPLIGAGFISHRDAPLLPGTYYYRIANVSPDGKLQAWTGQRTATVT